MIDNVNKLAILGGGLGLLLLLGGIGLYGEYQEWQKDHEREEERYNRELDEFEKEHHNDDVLRQNLSFSTVSQTNLGTNDRPRGSNVSLKVCNNNSYTSLSPNVSVQLQSRGHSSLFYYIPPVSQRFTRSVPKIDPGECTNLHLEFRRPSRWGSTLQAAEESFGNDASAPRDVNDWARRPAATAGIFGLIASFGNAVNRPIPHVSKKKAELSFENLNKSIYRRVEPVDRCVESFSAKLKCEYLD